MELNSLFVQQNTVNKSYNWDNDNVGPPTQAATKTANPTPTATPNNPTPARLPPLFPPSSRRRSPAPGDAGSCSSVGRRREDARLRRRRRVREVRRQAAAVGDLDLEPHPFLALRAVAGFGEEVVGALDGERDGDGGGARGRRRRVAVAGAVDEGLRVLGVAERVGGGVRRLNHRRAVIRLEDWKSKRVFRYKLASYPFN